MDARRQLLDEFVAEAKEHLANVADDLLALEQHTDASASFRIDRVFRAVHSVKGAAAFLGCRAVERVSHAMETVLEPMREADSPPGPGVVDALLAGTDRVLALLDDLDHAEEADVTAVVDRLRSLPAPPPSPPRLAFLTLDPAARTDALAERPAGQAYLYGLKLDLAEGYRSTGLSPLEVLQRLQAGGTVLEARLAAPDSDLAGGLGGPVWYEAVYASALSPDELPGSLALPGLQFGVIEAPEPPPPAPAPVVPSPAPVAVPPTPEPAPPALTTSAEHRPETSVRLSVQLLDRLVTLAGELVLVRNQVLRTVDPDDPALRPIVQRLDAVTGELQEAVMRTRMQPVGNLFGKFPRMVRDLARQLGKEIELTTGGTEVELDKSVMEALSDPLVHLVRNCCDHGLETPVERFRAGKLPEGTVELRARHVGGQIHITVRDDGRGIDPDRVRRKAIERGLRSPAELARLTDKEALGLILLPGFSTAEVVTDVSGRGVGMDVVRNNLEQLGGGLEIDSVVGRGTSFTLRVPLTLAIIPCLIVEAAGERFALPQKDLEELVYVPAKDVGRVEWAHDQEVYRLRQRLLPLVRLQEVLHGSAGRRPAARGACYFAVVKVGTERFGLVVDNILNTEEIVVKPLHPALKGLACYSGSTIMGDGRVALILSVEGIARQVGVRFDVADAAAVDEEADAAAVRETQTLLLFRYGPAEQFAVPLGLVRRVERVRADRIERVGNEEFLTVDGVSTLVLRPDRFLSVSACPPRDEWFLLLPRNLRRPMGVLFSEVIDTETVAVDLNTDAFRADGVLGSTVVRGRMTLLLDIFRLGDLTAPVLPAAPRPAALAPVRRRVLLVEDTQFFRQLVRGYLEGAGYEVAVAENGAEGLEELRASPFDLIVSDIEMPVMDGWTFARLARQEPNGRAVPLLALTTLNSDADKARMVACGFDRHEVKIDRERFLGAVAALLAGARG